MGAPANFLNLGQLLGVSRRPRRIRLLHFGNNEVKCIFCCVQIRDWVQGDSAMGEHLKYSPRCKFLCRAETENVPIDPKDLEFKMPPISSLDVCGTGWKPLDTVVEGTIGVKTLERLEHARMREYCIKYGYRLIKILPLK